MCYMPLERTKWAKSPCCIPSDCQRAEKAAKANARCWISQSERPTLQINQINLFTTCWWHQKNQKVLTIFFSNTAIFLRVRTSHSTFFLHPSKLFEPFEGPVSIATKVGCVCVCVSVYTVYVCVQLDLLHFVMLTSTELCLQASEDSTRLKTRFGLCFQRNCS